MPHVLVCKALHLSHVKDLKMPGGQSPAEGASAIDVIDLRPSSGTLAGPRRQGVNEAAAKADRQIAQSNLNQSFTLRA
jgi:hypothetical protein